MMAFPLSGCKNTLKSYPYEVSLKQATQIMGAPLPYPSYLPEGFEVIGIYVTEQTKDFAFAHMVFLISDNLTADIKALTKEDLSQPSDIIEMMMYIRNGLALGIKLPGGERYDIGSTKGVLLQGENVNDLLWDASYSELRGTYEIDLEAIKRIPTDELVKIARSVPQ